jgi:outer membrane protein assembly factor BamB
MRLLEKRVIGYGFPLQLPISLLFTFTCMAGCGGGGTPGGLATSGRASFTVTWPSRSRLVPKSSNSISIVLQQGAVQVAGELITRPENGGTSTVTLRDLPLGGLSARATAFPNADGSGVPQATAVVPIVIQANQTTPIVLSMASTIDHLAPISPMVSITTGLSTQLSATALDASGGVVLTSPLSWEAPNPSIASIDALGILTANSAGSTNVTVTETESGKSITIPVLVSVIRTPAVAYQIDVGHSGSTTFGTVLAFPTSPSWSVQLSGAISYPLIVGGTVYVFTSNHDLYALNKATGATLWGPKRIGGSDFSYPSSGPAYDRGKIFVLSPYGLLESFDAATGRPGWSAQLGQGLFVSPPTASNGIVYTGGEGAGVTFFAVDENNGTILRSVPIPNGSVGSPVISQDGVFVTCPCQVHKFDPITGSVIWEYIGPCGGGTGYTAAYKNGKLYARDIGASSSAADPWIFDAITGMKVGTFDSVFIPALNDTMGFFLAHAFNTSEPLALNGVDLASGAVRWTFAGDERLLTNPIVIDQTAIVGSNSGMVYALDASTGSLIWSGSAGAPIQPPQEINIGQPLSAMAAGEGYLVVPAGSILTAWHLSGP